MISKDKQYRTRDGREVRIYSTHCGIREPVHGAIKDDGEWILCVWNMFGKVVKNSDHIDDLIEVKPRIKREYWHNVYSHGKDVNIHTSREDADVCAHKDRLACVKVTIDCEEGEGL